MNRNDFELVEKREGKRPCYGCHFIKAFEDSFRCTKSSYSPEWRCGDKIFIKKEQEAKMKDKNLTGGVEVISYKHTDFSHCPNGESCQVGSPYCCQCNSHLYRYKDKKIVFCAYKMKKETRFIINGVGYSKKELVARIISPPRDIACLLWYSFYREKQNPNPRIP